MHENIDLSSLDNKMKRRFLRTVKPAIIDAKHTLSSIKQSDMVAPNALGKKHIVIDHIRRNDFEKCMTGKVGDKINYIDKITDTLDNALQRVNLYPSEIDTVVCVGGSTQIPLIKNLITNTFVKAKVVDTSGSQPGTEGSAIYAAYLYSKQSNNKNIWNKWNKVDYQYKENNISNQNRLSYTKKDTYIVSESTELYKLPIESRNVLYSKLKNEEYDIFLCHNNEDKVEVKEIAKQLMARGILPWLDEWDLQPGFPWQIALEKQIENIKSAAVFVGKNGLGPWQNMELLAFLRQFSNRKCPVIPVLLCNCDQNPELPAFLCGLQFVDFRSDRNPLDRLIWGITGKRLNLDYRF